jgi:hypothetical protein
MAKSERDEIRESYADRPGVGHHVERVLNERQLAVDEGAPEERVAGFDRALAGFGYTSRAKAADDRKAAAARKADKEAADEREAAAEKARRTPPAGRQSSPRDKT